MGIVPERLAETWHRVAESGAAGVVRCHRNLERYGDATEQMRAIFDHPNGWTGTLDRFAELAKRRATQRD